MQDIKNRRIMQIGYVVRDVERSIEDHSKHLGIGPWDLYTFCAPDLRDAVYRGRPIDHKFIVAILWNGTTQLELIQPVTGTNIYTEFLDRRGDGLHHVKEWVDDCQKELQEYRSRGIDVLQSGKFDEDEHYYLVYRLAYNSDVAAGQLAVFQGASRTGGKAPISESYGSIRRGGGKTANWPRPGGLR